MNKFLKITSVITLLLFLRVSFAQAADQVYYYYTDPAGTPLVMSDSTGTVVWRADYLPFGEETIDTSTVPNNKMFVGKEKDSETGLHYFGARYMDSTAGRFTSTDPKGPVEASSGKANEKFLLNPQRFNRYAYAGNNPYKFIDPDGLDWYYAQESGRLVYHNVQTNVYIDFGVGRGSAGNGDGKNNSFDEGKSKIGPLVAGTYTVGEMKDYTKQNGKVLKNAMTLTPDENTESGIENYGRTGGFLIHGGKYSEGCILMSANMRSTMDMLIKQTNDNVLHVNDFLPEDMTKLLGGQVPPR